MEKQDILEIYNTFKGRYGYRHICSELKAIGYAINHKTVFKTNAIPLSTREATQKLKIPFL